MYFGLLLFVSEKSMKNEATVVTLKLFAFLTYFKKHM